MAESVLVELGLALTGLAVAGTLANRVDLSVIPAYIVVGILIGPNEPSSVAGISLTLVDNHEFIEILSELGVIFLLFFLGLEFNIGQLFGDLDRIAKIGAVDLVVNFGIGLAIGVLFGWSPVETLFLAGIVYISSSAVITKSLIEQGWVANPESDPILGTLVVEDILIAVYLALLSAVALGGGDVGEAAAAVGAAFVFLGALTAIAWYGTSLVERLFSTPSDELFLLRVLGVTVLVAALALTTGVSEAVAAFFVGTAFSQTAHVERIEQIVAPARDLFAAVFFFAIGLTTDVTLLAGVAGLLLAAVVLTTLGKMASGTLSGRLYGFDTTRSLRVGIGLVPRGEFSLVIAALAAGAGSEVLRSVVPAFTVGYVLVMSILGTVMIQHASAITRFVGEFQWAP